MQPDTILEALLGKIAKDEDCLGKMVTPETKLETYLNQIAHSYSFAPATSPLNANAYLVSDGTNGTKWVKRLNVVFTTSTTAEAQCTASYEDIVEAINSGVPMEVRHYDYDGGKFVHLQLAYWERENGMIMFSGTYLDPGLDLTTKVCTIDSSDAVAIYNRGGTK